MPQGRPQVVRNRIRKGFQFLVGGFKLRGPFDNPPFQFIIQFFDLLLRSLISDQRLREFGRSFLDPQFQFLVELAQRLLRPFAPLVLPN